MVRSHLVLPLLAGCLVLPLAACGSEGDSELAQPTVEVGTPTDTGSGPTQDAFGDPFTFESRGAGCTRAPGRYLLWDRFSSDRPVTLDGVELVAADGSARITAAEVIEAPSEAAPTSGLVRGSEPPPADRRRTDWAGRRPLDGARIDSSTTYYFFLQIDLPPRGSYDAIDVAWEGELDEAGSSRFHDRLEVRRDCATRGAA